MKKRLLMVMLIGTFLLTGCNKIKLNTFIANEEEEPKVTQALDENSISNSDDASGETANTSDTIDTVDGIADNEDASKDASADTKGNNAGASENNESSKEGPTSGAIQPPVNTALSIYTINIDGEVEPITALVSKDTEITPEIIVDKVIESLADQSIEIGVKSVTIEKNKIIVNFDPDKSPDKNMGSYYEGAILNAIAQSLIDNLSQYNGVIFRINDGAYATGAYEYGIDEAFLGDN